MSAHADLVLTGPTSMAGVYSTAGLAAISSPSDTVNFDGLTGISLWGLLGGAPASGPRSPIYGDITTSTPAGRNGKNAILRYYLVATAPGGADSLLSLGALDPSFGGTTAVPPFIAFETTAGNLLSEPELIVPGGAGRNLPDLTGLRLLAVPAIAGVGGPSSAIDLSGGVSKPGSYTKADLESGFTPVSETVAGDTYTGAPLYTFLDPTGPSVTDQLVIAQATDGYEVVYALAELDPALGGNPADLLPYADTAGQFPSAGVARTVLPDDNKLGRWVSNVDAIDVETVLQPPTLPILVASIGFLTPAASRNHRCGHRGCRSGAK